MIITWLTVGLIAAAIYLRLAALRPQTEAFAWASGLVIASLVYVVFAVRSGSAAWVATEIAGVAAYGALAWLGLRYSLIWLAAGWLLHIAWDTVLHLWLGGSGFAPQWYVLVCLSFDLLVAAAIIRKYRAHRPAAAGVRR